MHASSSENKNNLLIQKHKKKNIEGVEKRMKNEMNICKQILYILSGQKMKIDEKK